MKSVLIGVRIDVLRMRCTALIRLCPRSLANSEQLQPGFDVGIARIQGRGPPVGVEGIVHLIVAGFVQSPEVVPDFGYVWVEANCARVRVEGVAVLVDLVVEDADRAPESRVPAVPVHGLLVGFIGLVVLSLCHVASSEQVPALSVGAIRLERLRQKLDGGILVGELRALLMVQPAELL